MLAHSKCGPTRAVDGRKKHKNMQKMMVTAQKIEKDSVLSTTGTRAWSPKKQGCYGTQK